MYYEHEAIIYKTYPTPKWWEKLFLRLRFGRDSFCDFCGVRTYWNGNVGCADTILCDDCHSKNITNT